MNLVNFKFFFRNNIFRGQELHLKPNRIKDNLTNCFMFISKKKTGNISQSIKSNTDKGHPVNFMLLSQMFSEARYFILTARKCLVIIPTNRLQTIVL